MGKMTRRTLMATAIAAITAPTFARSAFGAEPVDKGKRAILGQFRIAGSYYYGGVEMVLKGCLRVGDSLLLKHELNNPHDSMAIVILHQKSGKKIGYVPRSSNHSFAHLSMSGHGNSIRAVVTEILKNPFPHFVVLITVEAWLEQ